MQYQRIIPHASQSFWIQVLHRINKILTYIQRIGLEQEYYVEDIKVLFEAVGKHYL